MKNHTEKKRYVKASSELPALQGAALVSLTLSLTVVRVTMNFFQHRYYRLNKIMLVLIGHWPYQSVRTGRGILILLSTIAWIQLVPLSLALVKYRIDENVLLDGTVAVTFGAITVAKGLGFTCNSQKTFILVNRIRMDWLEWARDEEVNILHQYAEQGRRMTIAYIVMNIINHSTFMTQPMFIKIIDNVLYNGTAPGTLPYPIDFYYFDVQKYYFYVIAYAYVFGSIETIVTAASGVMLICYTHHACGIFAAVGHKLEQLGNIRTSVKTSETRYEMDKNDIMTIVSSINRRNIAIEYVELIAAIYSWVFFFTIGFGTIMFNVVGLQILLKSNDLKSIMRYIISICTISTYFFVDCYVAETVTIHSMSIFFCIHNSKWYKLSLKAQKFLQLMKMRCSVPCQLTAGKMLHMSRRNYGQTMKAGLSYFAFLRSMRPV